MLRVLQRHRGILFTAFTQQRCRHPFQNLGIVRIVGQHFLPVLHDAVVVFQFKGHLNQRTLQFHAARGIREFLEVTFDRPDKIHRTVARLAEGLPQTVVFHRRHSSRRLSCGSRRSLCS